MASGNWLSLFSEVNLAHLHLILNHIPVLGIPLALIFLVHGLATKNGSSQKFALIVLTFLAAIALPVFFTGESAEENVEHFAGVTESLISSHENAAKVSLALTMVLGGMAFASIWFQKRQQVAQVINIGIACFAIIATITLFQTAKLGGQIRHNEIQSSSISAAFGGSIDKNEAISNFNSNAPISILTKEAYDKTIVSKAAMGKEPDSESNESDDGDDD